MIARLKDLTFGSHGEQHITVTVRSDFRRQYDELHNEEITVEIKPYRRRRSLSANSYFHLLVNKIAERQGLGNDEVKRRLVCEYGTLAKGDDGGTIGFKLPEDVNVLTIYPYAKQFDVREEGGRRFCCYLVYKQTHLMDSREMARLIDGAIFEAKDLGIETDTPEQIARLKENWSKKQ